MTFEKRHREFRRAERKAVADNPVTQVLQGQRAWLELLAFERRIGPLADEVVEVAREATDRYEDADAGTYQAMRFTDAMERLRDAIRALDEEAAK